MEKKWLVCLMVFSVVTHLYCLGLADLIFLNVQIVVTKSLNKYWKEFFNIYHR